MSVGTLELLRMTNALGWTLLHSLWQGTLVALLLALILQFTSSRAAGLRYGIALAALGLMLALPVYTFMVILTSTASAEPVTVILSATDSIASLPESSAAPPLTVTAVGSNTLWWSNWAAFSSKLEAVLPWISVLWMVGVALVSLRLLLGWLHVRRLRHVGVSEIDGGWMVRLELLRERLRISRPVNLLCSALVQVPTAIGWLRPVVLLPASALIGLSPSQLEAVIAHELAHIRRHDYLVNLLQCLVDVLLFYHPAVWWVSERIRVEREHCCDDLAVMACGNARTYARALTELEELRAIPPQLAMGATGGIMLGRIRRLLNLPVSANDRGPRWMAGAMALAAIFTLGATASAARGNMHLPSWGSDNGKGGLDGVGQDSALLLEDEEWEEEPEDLELWALRDTEPPDKATAPTLASSSATATAASAGKESESFTSPALAGETEFIARPALAASPELAAMPAPAPLPEPAAKPRPAPQPEVASLPAPPVQPEIAALPAPPVQPDVVAPPAPLVPPEVEAPPAPTAQLEAAVLPVPAALPVPPVPPVPALPGSDALAPQERAELAIDSPKAAKAALEQPAIPLLPAPPAAPKSAKHGSLFAYVSPDSARTLESEMQDDADSSYSRNPASEAADSAGDFIPANGDFGDEVRHIAGWAKRWFSSDDEDDTEDESLESDSADSPWWVGGVLVPGYLSEEGWVIPLVGSEENEEVERYEYDSEDDIDYDRELPPGIYLEGPLDDEWLDEVEDPLEPRVFSDDLPDAHERHEDGWLDENEREARHSHEEWEDRHARNEESEEDREYEEDEDEWLNRTDEDDDDESGGSFNFSLNNGGFNIHIEVDASALDRIRGVIDADIGHIQRDIAEDLSVTLPEEIAEALEDLTESKQELARDLAELESRRVAIDRLATTAPERHAEQHGELQRLVRLERKLEIAQDKLNRIEQKLREQQSAPTEARIQPRPPDFESDIIQLDSPILVEGNTESEGDEEVWIGCPQTPVDLLESEDTELESFDGSDLLDTEDSSDLLESARELREDVREEIESVREDAQERMEDLREDIRERAEELREEAREREEELREAAREREDERREAAEERAEELREAAEERAEELRGAAQERAKRGQERAEREQERAEREQERAEREQARAERAMERARERVARREAARARARHAERAAERSRRSADEWSDSSSSDEASGASWVWSGSTSPFVVGNAPQTFEAYASAPWRKQVLVGEILSILTQEATGLQHDGSARREIARVTALVRYAPKLARKLDTKDVDGKLRVTSSKSEVARELRSFCKKTREIFGKESPESLERFIDRAASKIHRIR